MPDVPIPSNDFTAQMNDVVRRLRAVERLLLIGGDDEALTPLQTFENGVPLGDTLGINFGTGVHAVSVGDGAVKVDTCFRGERFEANRLGTDANQTILSGAQDQLTFIRAFFVQSSGNEDGTASTTSKEGTYFSWDSGSPGQITATRKVAVCIDGYFIYVWGSALTTQAEVTIDIRKNGVSERFSSLYVQQTTGPQRRQVTHFDVLEEGDTLSLFVLNSQTATMNIRVAALNTLVMELPC